MATKDEAIKAWKEFRDKVQIKTPVRYVLTGNGQGDGVDNLYVPFKPDHIYVREYSDLNRAFPVLNRGKVGPYINMPVVIGFDQIEPEREQVLGINYDALPGNVSTSAIYSIGKHHIQHEFGGGDEVWLDSRQFMPGVVVPTNPPSMSVEVRPFVSYYDQWRRYEGGTTDSLESHKPTDDRSKYVLIALDQLTGSLIYKDGLPFNVQSTFDVLINAGSEVNGIDYLPTIGSTEVPLGAIFLTSATSVLSWIGAGSNMIDARLHNGYSIADLVNRINLTQATLGYSDSLPTTGAAAFPVPEYNPYWNHFQPQPGTNNIFRLDSDIGVDISEPLARLHIGGGDVRIGEINPIGTGGFPGYGRKIYFSGGPAGDTYNSDNSDALFISRWNKDTDRSHLRVSIGDNKDNTNDAFVIGCSALSDWHDRLIVYSDGKVVFTAPSATSANDLGASQMTFYVKEDTNEIVFLVKYADSTTVKAGSVTLS
jgi:hypothetical protein